MASEPVLIDGTPCSTIDVRDRGLAYGDGLFETTAVVQGAILNWSWHMGRLSDGCARLAIPMPDQTLLHDEILAVAADHERSVVKLTLTRGPGGHGYTPPPSPNPVRIVARRPWPEDYAAKSSRGIRVGFAQHPLSINPELAGLKHLNRLDQVLASREMAAAHWDEALMRDPDGRVIEATRSNLFAMINGVLVTPTLDRSGVRGVMRSIVLALAPSLDLATRETSLLPRDLETADELFVCNALAGVWPIVSLHGSRVREFVVGRTTIAIRKALVSHGHQR